MPSKDWKKFAFVKKAYGITGCISSHHFLCRPRLARAYLKARAADAVECYKAAPHRFHNPVELAQHLARYW